MHALLRSNVALLREHVALLTLNVAKLKFMDCVLDFKIRIYLPNPETYLPTYILIKNWGTRHAMHGSIISPYVSEGKQIFMQIDQVQ